MKGKDIAITALAIVAGIFVVLFITEKVENARLLKKNDDLQDDKLKLLKDNLESKKAISPEIKNQINKLIEFYRSTHPSVSEELTEILTQIQSGQEIKAIRDLAKIIENLLREKYRNEPKFSGLKRITLKPLIEYAREVHFLNEKLYHSACILCQFRNQESHELAVKDTDNMKLTALLAGLEIIFLIKT
jgi:hypothetical protein